MTPYFYKIKHIPSGCYYVGSQYGKQSCPDNLFKTYFTSSKIIKTLIKNDGIDSFNIEKILINNNARNYEKRYLKKSFNLLGKEKFLQIFLNRNMAPGILNTKESIERGNIKRRISNKTAAIERVKNGTHNFLIKKHIPTESERVNTSLRMQGNRYGSLINRDEEYREKQSEKSKGNKNVRNKKWWNNGQQRKRNNECPGEGWKAGYKIN
jgi:hypothetical protein